jgi:acylphosphatase
MNEALKLGIGGWVRNLDDGRVEVAAEGSGENLDRFIDWCAVGPRSARVDKVDMSVEQATGDSSFEIRWMVDRFPGGSITGKAIRTAENSLTAPAHRLYN